MNEDFFMLPITGYGATSLNIQEEISGGVSYGG